MDVKIRHKLIEIEDHVSDRFVILITNYRWLRILVIRRMTSTFKMLIKESINLFRFFNFMIVLT